MGFFSKKAPGKAASKAKPAPGGGSALNAKQRALQEEEQKLKAQMEKYKNFVENAPKLAAEIQREQREELLRRAATTHKGSGRSTALFDRRTTLEANVAAPAQQRRMRAERRQGRLMFFVLL